MECRLQGPPFRTFVSIPRLSDPRKTKKTLFPRTIHQAFKARALNLLKTPVDLLVYFYVELAIFGQQKLEVDPETWPRMEGLISDVWISESVPFPETEESPESSALQPTTGTENVAPPGSARPLPSDPKVSGNPVCISLSVDHEYSRILSRSLDQCHRRILHLPRA